MSELETFLFYLSVVSLCLLYLAILLHKRERRRKQIRSIPALLCVECGHPRLRHIPLHGCTVACECPWDGNS